MFGRAIIFVRPTGCHVNHYWRRCWTIRNVDGGEYLLRTWREWLLKARDVRCRWKLRDGRCRDSSESRDHEPSFEIMHYAVFENAGARASRPQSSAYAENRLQSLPKMTRESRFRCVWIAAKSRVEDFEVLLDSCNRQRFRDEALLADEEKIFVQAARRCLDERVP